MKLFGIDKEIWEIVIQLATLGTTVYFTSKLVKNDDNREARHEKERLNLKFVKYLKPFAEIGHGALQSAGKNLITKNPGYKELVFLAYEDLADENPAKYPSISKFEEMLSDVDVRRDKK